MSAFVIKALEWIGSKMVRERAQAPRQVVGLACSGGGAPGLAETKAKSRPATLDDFAMCLG